uniref:BART domain-containing protein n=1 Tax=Knipowitschia caucasica TaxID=637954 RepID=A0AAV2MR55_KNICA
MAMTHKRTSPDCSPQIGAELNVGGVKRLTPPTLSSAERELGIEDCAYDREGEEAEEKKSEVAGRAVEMLRMCDGLDEEYKEDLSEPFMFMFSLQADYEEFCKEMMDKRQLQVFSGFEMR